MHISESAAFSRMFALCLTRLTYFVAVYRPDQCDGTADAAHDETAVVPGPISTMQDGDYRPTASMRSTSSDHRPEAVREPEYLTLSHLSPRKCEAPVPAPGTSDPPDAEETPDSAIDTAAATSGPPPPPPVRTSIKRAGSPAVELPAHTRKRSKTASEQPAPLAYKERKTRVQPSRVKKAPAAATSSGPLGASRTRRVVSATASVTGADRAARVDGANRTGGSSKSLSKLVPGGEGNAATLTAAHSVQGLSKSSQSKRNATVPTSRSGHFTRSHRENVPTNQEHPTAGQTAGRSTSAATDRLVRPHAGFPSECFLVVL